MLGKNVHLLSPPYGRAAALLLHVQTTLFNSNNTDSVDEKVHLLSLGPQGAALLTKRFALLAPRRSNTSVYQQKTLGNNAGLIGKDLHLLSARLEAAICGIANLGRGGTSAYELSISKKIRGSRHRTVRFSSSRPENTRRQRRAYGQESKSRISAHVLPSGKVKSSEITRWG